MNQLMRSIDFDPGQHGSRYTILFRPIYGRSTTIFMISNQGSVILFVYTTRASQIILVPDAQQQHVCKFVLPPYTCCIINHDRPCFLFLYVIHATIE